MTRKSETYGVDVPPVTRDEALELMVHHLQLAAAYFEATPEDANDCYVEMGRLMAGTKPALVGARAFYSSLVEHYAKMED